MLKDQYFDSKTRIHVCRWEPEGRPRAILQIVHGIAEYSARYDHFAQFLTKHGYLVIAEDHMGHGESMDDNTVQGYFSGGWFAAVADTYYLLEQTKAEFPDVPYILFGHSMGSFMVRTILQEYPDSGISGCVICGTGWLPEAVVKTGLQLAKAICKKSGEKVPSEFLNKVVFAGYNKRVEHRKTTYDWLNRDEREVAAYLADSKCGFIPSAGLLRDMLIGILHIQKKANLKKMRSELPIYFIAGGDDPVGDYGKGVRKTSARFVASGMQDVSCKIYPLCRHEILNEINRSEVYEDVLEWAEMLI